METFTLDRGAGTKVVISKYGATIISWTINDVEMVFVSPKAKLDGSKAIRGGVPICFPSFGPWAQGPQHGFARTSMWEVTETKDASEGDDMAVTLSLTETPAWDQKFELNFTVTLMESSLKMNLLVKNKNTDSPFEFTTALHTYFKVPDVEKVSIKGLKDLEFRDKTVEGTPVLKEERDGVSLSGWTDRVYLGSGDEQVIEGVQGGKIVFRKKNLSDTVVWNPWEQKAGEMGDLGSENWKGFICVEAGQCVTPISLGPGQEWEGVHSLEFVRN